MRLAHDAVVGNEGQEGGLVGQDIAAHFLGHDQARAHAGVGGDVPLGIVHKGFGFLGDAQGFGPQSQLLGVGAGTVTAGDEGVLAVSNGSEGVQNGSGGFHACGIGGGTAQDEVVVDEADALGLKAVDHTAEAIGDESFLLTLGVDQNQVGVSGLGGGDGLAGTGGLDLHGVAVGSFKSGQQVTQQTGVVDRRMVWVSSVAAAISPV